MLKVIREYLKFSFLWKRSIFYRYTSQLRQFIIM